MTDRTIFLIPEAHMPRLEREVAKLSRKAEKLNGWSFDILPIGHQYRDNGNGSKTKLIEVCLDVDLIKIDGWQFVARIDHAHETGNVLRAVPNTVIDPRFRTVAPNCEHCNHKRRRRDTFVLLNEQTGEYKQVGSTCIADFLGHNAADLGRIAELAGYANELARSIEREPTDGEQGLIEHRHIDLFDFLIHTATMIRLNGWVSGKTAYENGCASTRERAIDNMFPAPQAYPEKPTDEDIDLATKALDWAQAFREKADLNDYEHNVLVIAESPVIAYRSAGIAATIVGVYWAKFAPKRGQTDLGDLKPMLALFKQAGSRLKYPKVNLTTPEGEAIVLSVAGDRAKQPGTINIATPGSFEFATWFGRIGLDGKFSPSRQAPKGLEEYLLKFAADPYGVITENGFRTGNCACCNRRLNDKRSLALGVGPICAEKWDLKKNWKEAA